MEGVRGSPDDEGDGSNGRSTPSGAEGTQPEDQVGSSSSSSSSSEEDDHRDMVGPVKRENLGAGGVPYLEVGNIRCGYTERYDIKGEEQMLHWVVKNTVRAFLSCLFCFFSACSLLSSLLFARERCWWDAFHLAVPTGNACLQLLAAWRLRRSSFLFFFCLSYFILLHLWAIVERVGCACLSESWEVCVSVHLNFFLALLAHCDTNSSNWRHGPSRHSQSLSLAGDSSLCHSRTSSC